ncbi:Crp/Fnr family transcriptional regulator [Chryseobacterium sp. W4I1]|uniref:Crp/Fnr family transcriptional regulator n=1 Tax=Chryseobacterium sp. W4I1 TaxID=3042293 RepID=UPI002785F3F6|nr:Crp/Fnr family transcriptional regulator [Chryseobacterium sp. W4I1]MDQ0783067.1 CRP-like cAMP-binding protein [Chryseobacterium sp. W4I1]
MTASLKEHILKHIQISDEHLEEFCNAFTFQKIIKKEFLLKEGEHCKFEGFVINGCFKVYHSDQKGTEQILYFAIEDWWITDVDSFTTLKPSQLNIQALENSEVLLISKADKEALYQKIPEIEKLFRIMSQKTLIALQRRIIENLSKTADQRYVDFITKYPQIAGRLTNIQIGAYLGISHEFVSRIRRKIVTKN